MNKFLTTVNNSIRSFSKDEEGAQVVEYALIIAVVSLGLIVLMGALVNGDAFQGWIDKVATCLGGTCTE
jgi:pilus assembly protein Flp/PilA